MEKLYAILNTDEINKYNQKFTITSLNLALKDNFEVGAPQCLSHDRLRPAGWILPFGLYFEPNLCLLLGTSFLPKNEEEQQEIVRLHQSALVRQHSEMCEPHLSQFKKMLETDSLENVIYASCVANQREGIVKEYFPKLYDHTDKDGLFPLSLILDDFEYLGQGVFKCRATNLAIFTHPYFRKSQSRFNNFNFFFLDKLVELNERKDLEIKLKIDPDLIGDGTTYLDSHELEYWWGPKFDEDISKIPTGVTRHEANEIERIYNLISRTEFYWKTDNNEKVLEIEELKDIPVKDEKFHNRYLHSIYSEKENFRHFDGAIRAYDESQMINRLDVDLKKAPRDTEYTKLFRIDGNLDFSTWKSLINHYFQGNQQVKEYFGIENKNTIGKKLIDEDSKNTNVLDRLVPYKIDKDDGPRIMWSYHIIDADKKNANKRFISSYDLLTISSGTIKIIESDITEIIKALNRMDAEIELPNDVIFASCEDLYWNIPAISHHFNTNLEERIDETIRVFISILKSLKKKSTDKVISFTLGWSSDFIKETRLSIFGHCEDILEWIENNYPFPLQPCEENKWLERQAKWLENNYKSKRLKPPIFELINNDGVIYINRTAVSSDFDYSLENTDMGVKILFKFEPDQIDVAKHVENGSLQIANGFIIKESECSKCKQSYKDCPHSKILDSNICQIVTDAQLYGLVWTDKKA